jgi:hypothetical protein
MRSSLCKFIPLAHRAALLIAIGLLGAALQGSSQDRSDRAPKYQVDPYWPKQLPNNWIMGQIGGLTVDQHDHIWALQRPGSLTVDEKGATLNPPRSMCCVPAPPVMEFDPEGNLLHAWGGPGAGFEWPASEHGIYVDKEDNVWVGGAGPNDHQVLKFTRDGRFLMQIGHAGKTGGSLSHDLLGRPARIAVDDQNHEVYVADGYLNRRIIVFDSQTGAFKRLWGAYGNPPEDKDPGAYDPSAPPAQQFRNPVHCVHISHDDLVYVCDRTSDRIQVFTKQGRFVKEFFVEKSTLGQGSAWDLAFSGDKDQAFLEVADGENNVVWTLSRGDGKSWGTTGHSGRNAGQFHWVHQITRDSRGNLYTGEVDTAKRLQKFVLVPSSPRK